MKKILLVLLSVLAIVSMASCGISNAKNISLADISPSNESFLSSEQSISTNESQGVSNSIASVVSNPTTSYQYSMNQSSNIVSSKSNSSSTVQSSNISNSVVPTVPAPKAITFDDPILEKLLRDLINKPTGTCYPSDFSQLSKSDEIFINYSLYNNQTSIIDSFNMESSASITGIPSSFAVFSQIPIRNIRYFYITPAERDDIAMTFNLNWITASKELVYFCFKGLDDIATRTRLVQHMTFTNFNTLATCPKLKTLVLWDSKGVSLDSVSGFQNLETLSLNNCNITSIEAIRNCPKLTTLELHNNNITNFTPLTNHPSLKTIKLTGISSPIDTTPFLTIPTLDDLVLIDCISLSGGDLSKLTANGVKVSAYKTK